MVEGGAAHEIQALKRKAMADAQEIAHLQERAQDQAKEIRRLQTVVEKWQPMIEDMEAMRRVLGTTSKTGEKHGS